MPRKRAHNEAETASEGPPQQKRKVSGPPDLKSRLVDTTVRSGIEALLKDANDRERKRAKRASQKGKTVGDLMASDVFVYLAVTLKEPPFKPKLRPYAIPLKNSLYRDGEDDVCFFVKDPEDLVKDHLEEREKTAVTEVMGVHRLRKEYSTHEGRRELLGMYDLFLVDNRVSPMMPGLLGNAFLNAKRLPLQVDMGKDVVTGIRKAISSTALTLRQGTSTTVRIGRTDFSPNQLVENLNMAVDGVVKRLPGGWRDVQSLNIKSNKSPALPIYCALPTASKQYVKALEASGSEAIAADLKEKPKNGTGKASLANHVSHISSTQVQDDVPTAHDKVPSSSPDNKQEPAAGKSKEVAKDGKRKMRDQSDNIEDIPAPDSTTKKRSTGKRKKAVKVGSRVAVPASVPPAQSAKNETSEARPVTRARSVASSNTLGEQSKSKKRSANDTAKGDESATVASRRSTRKRVASTHVTEAEATPTPDVKASKRSARKTRSAKK